MREIELAFAAEAASHARAAAELNPFGEAEALELGDARAVYTGVWSPVHGVIGLGLDGPVEERDLREVEKFFSLKERAPNYWISPATDPSLLELLGRDYHAVKKIPVHGLRLGGIEGEAPSPSPFSGIPALPEPTGTSQPEHAEWSLAFTRLTDPLAKEPGLLALVKLHQKETRFYLNALAGNSASYTYFSRGVALVPHPSSHGLLALQADEAHKYRARFFAAGAACPLPFLYERTLFERI